MSNLDFNSGYLACAINAYIEEFGPVPYSEWSNTRKNSGECEWVSLCLRQRGGDLSNDPRFCIQPINSREGDVFVSEKAQTDLLGSDKFLAVLSEKHKEQFREYLKTAPSEDACVQIWFMYLGLEEETHVFASYVDFQPEDLSASEETMGLFNGYYTYDQVFQACCFVRQHGEGRVMNICFGDLHDLYK